MRIFFLLGSTVVFMMRIFFLLGFAVVFMIGTLMVGRVVSSNPHVLELANRVSDIEGLYHEVDHEVAPEPWQQLVQGIEAAGKSYYNQLTARINLAVTDAQATGLASQQPDTEANFRQSLGARFQQAGKQIEDSDINTYYETLMEGMNPAFTDPDRKGLADQLPDIERIYHQSLTGPFQAADVEIRSPETRGHYQRLIEAAGLDK